VKSTRWQTFPPSSRTGGFIIKTKTIGKKINNFIKSYGSTFFFIRRPLVQFICCLISQIDEEQYQMCRSTTKWEKKVKQYLEYRPKNNKNGKRN